MVESEQITDDERRERLKAELLESAKNYNALEREVTQSRKILRELEERRDAFVRRANKEITTQKKIVKELSNKREESSHSRKRLLSEFVPRELLNERANRLAAANRADSQLRAFEQTEREFLSAIEKASEPQYGIRGGKKYKLRGKDKERVAYFEKQLADHRRVVAAQRAEVKRLHERYVKSEDAVAKAYQELFRGKP